MKSQLESKADTIPRTTDEGMRDIIDAIESETLYDPMEFDCARTVTLKVALKAMRRVSKTDEGRNAGEK